MVDGSRSTSIGSIAVNAEVSTRATARVAVVGSGVVGERTRRNLQLGHRMAPRVTDADVVVLASGGEHATMVAELIDDGRDVVSVAGSMAEVRQLLELDATAEAAGTSLVVGAAVCPGLSGLLARHLAASMHVCDELHVAVHGTAGPACAHEHHQSLAGRSLGWRDDRWTERPAGSGRELCWFPEPVGARDCYRGELADPLVLQQAFPDVDRITARVSATRRDRMTARLPMLSPPHAEGGIGALRVEARGADASGARVTEIVGIAELIGTAAAAVAAAMVDVVIDRRASGASGVITTADDAVPTHDVLRAITGYGVRLQTFTGVPEFA